MRDNTLMRTNNASLADPFDASPLLFPENDDPAPRGRATLGSVVHAPPAPMGSWRYTTRRGRKAALLLALLFSGGTHALLLLGFNTKPRPAPAPIEPTLLVNLIKMPEIPEDPEDKIEDLNKGEDVAEGIDVPRQADVPTTVILDNMMTQAFDPRSLQPNLNVNGTKLISIPGNIRIGGAGGTSIKEIFNLADLDRAPVPIFQPPPNIPSNLKTEGSEVKLVVEFIVNNKGEVVDARILDSSDPRYDNLTMTTVMKWKFKPGYKKGRPVASRIHQPFIITIGADSP